MTFRDDLKDAKKELLEEHYLEVITKINHFNKIERGFILRDLLDDEKNSNYFVYMTKGILLTLLSFNYIRIISTYNGNKNYVYLCNKEIKLENVNK